MTTKIVVAFLATIFFIFAISAIASAQSAPTADSLEVEDARGKLGTDVEVPVKIVNVSNGPVQGIRFTVDYNENVLTLTTDISSGDLTSNWEILQLGVDRHNMTIATSNTEYAIQNGSTGSVVLLKFHVIGSPGDTSPMNMVDIELSDPEGMVGTAPATNGAFKVESSNGGGSSENGGTGGGGGGSRYTPTSAPTEKPPAVSEDDEEEELTEPHSPTLAPNVTPSSETPVQTNASTTPELPAKANPIWVIVLIAVLIIAIISYMMFKHRKK